jgi:hypothetical protein
MLPEGRNRAELYCVLIAAGTLGVAGSSIIRSSEREKGPFGFRSEGQEIGVSFAKRSGDLTGGAVAAPNPHHLRWVTEQKGPLMKVRILRHDDEVVLGRVLLHDYVVGAVETGVTNVR